MLNYYHLKRSDDSDDERLNCHEKYDVKKEVNDYDVFSVDGTDVLLDASDFDADALFNDNLDAFDPIENKEAEVLVNKLKVGLNMIML